MLLITNSGFLAGGGLSEPGDRFPVSKRNHEMLKHGHLETEGSVLDPHQLGFEFWLCHFLGDLGQVTCLLCEDNGSASKGTCEN